MKILNWIKSLFCHHMLHETDRELIDTETCCLSSHEYVGVYTYTVVKVCRKCKKVETIQEKHMKQL